MLRFTKFLILSFRKVQYRSYWINVICFQASCRKSVDFFLRTKSGLKKLKTLKTQVFIQNYASTTNTLIAQNFWGFKKGQTKGNILKRKGLKCSKCNRIPLNILKNVCIFNWCILYRLLGFKSHRKFFKAVFSSAQQKETA